MVSRPNTYKTVEGRQRGVEAVTTDTDDHTINNSVTYPDGTTVTTSPGGIWTKDGNSPQTATAMTSDTYTLAGTYDQVWVSVFMEDVSGANNQIDLRYNGDTGTNYEYTENDDVSSVGTSQVDKILLIGANRAVTNTFLMGGRSSNEIAGGQHMIRAGANVAVGWSNTNVTPPLDSMTILGAGSFDIRWQVFGRDIGSGGVP